MRHRTPLTIEHIAVASNQPYEKVVGALEARLGLAQNWAAIRQQAEDAERLALYQADMNAFMTHFNAENRSATPPDPQEVANAIGVPTFLPSFAPPEALNKRLPGPTLWWGLAYCRSKPERGSLLRAPR